MQSSITNKTIIIPSFDSRDSICDYIYQTSHELSNSNAVIVILLSEQQSIYGFLKKVLTLQLFSGHKLYQNKVHYFVPISIIPFKRFKSVALTNGLFNWILLQVYLFLQTEKIILWNFFPFGSYFLHTSFIKIYTIFDCIDFHTSENNFSNLLLSHNRKYLATNSDLTVFISIPLKEAMEKLLNKKFSLVPQGFKINHFKKKANKILVKNHVRLRIGYIGLIGERLDYKLLYDVARKNYECDFIFAGEINFIPSSLGKKHYYQKKFLNLKNVSYLGRLSEERLLTEVSQFDICIIPYDTKMEFNKYCYPMKIMEYFYIKKPIISTNISMLKYHRELVYLGNSEKLWTNYIREISKHGWPKKQANLQRKLAIASTWSKKIEAISNLASLT